MTKPSDLYRQIADQLDRISALEDQLKTEKQRRETTEEQVRIADSQVNLLRLDNQAAQSRITELQSFGQHWHKKYDDNCNFVDTVESIFNNYDRGIFKGLESSITEARGLLKAEDYVAESEYLDEVEFISEQISLSQDINLIKGEFFDDQGEEEHDGEILLHEF